MKLRNLLVTSRNAVIEIEDGGIYYTKEPYQLSINGIYNFTTDRVISSIPDLKPDTVYTIKVSASTGAYEEITIITEHEFVTLNVRNFGAKGDGITNDSQFIQAAIMACPKEGRVLIPKGTYLITSLFLKSDLKLELAEGAVLQAETDRNLYPIYPGLIESNDETSEYNLGTWEGNPLPMYTGIITGVNVENVIIYGTGTIDGRAGLSDWWVSPKEKRGAYRPRLLFLNHCNKITIQGIHFVNSPSWTIHPYFSTNLAFYDLQILNPHDSPNTDGLDPESCDHVVIMGIRFSLGDDCIAIKSGKIYMGRKYKVPCRNIIIHQCYMENGHGAVTIGSEMAGGVRQVQVSDCIFRNTDRGLRIKTRRGRGKDAIIKDITFQRIEMDHVMTPFVVNCFYHCDPDGKTEYVWSKEELPVDDRTPIVEELNFSDINCKNCHVAAAYFYGLPEQKIKRISMNHITFHYADNAKSDIPDMMDGCEPCSKKGMFAANVESLELHKVSIEGQDGEAYILQDIDNLVKGE